MPRRGINLEDPNLRGFDAVRRLFLSQMINALANNQNAMNQSAL